MVWIYTYHTYVFEGWAGSSRGRGEVLGQAGAAEACAYTLEGVSKNQKSKITTNSSNSTTALLVPIFPPSPKYKYEMRVVWFGLAAHGNHVLLKVLVDTGD